ncbi:MAG: radical SAM protein [Candidatus Omnitrophica bacterium]|nr:radical SAM protein [Candidatus Omnitrophota bacterium]
MKVLLINPPAENEIKGSLPDIFFEVRGLYVPLGLLYLAGYLRKLSRHRISVIDSQVENLDYSALEDRIRIAHPDVVGMTALSATLVDVIKTAEMIKRIDKNIAVVLGGVHVFLFPEETIKFRDVDYLVLGEGEESFRELLEYIGDEEKLKVTPGLVFKRKDSIITTGIRPPIDRLDKIPFPARDLVPYRKYFSILSSNKITTTVFTSRGCSFRCSFCYREHLGGVLRFRSAENVVDELEECLGMGIDEFIFYDDTFTIDRNRVLGICSEIKRRRLDIPWHIRTRVDCVDEEMIRCLKRAGCQSIHYGVESGSEKVLKALNKDISLNTVKETFKLTKKYGIAALAYFMIGNPGETVEEIGATFKFMKELDPEYVHLAVLSPFPGTKIYLDGVASGAILRDYWREFARSPSSDFRLPYWEATVKREKLDSLLKFGYQYFYMRLGYLWKMLRRIKTFYEFKQKLCAGIKVFAMR